MSTDADDSTNDKTGEHKSTAPDPTDTDHPAGEQHAADNAANEPAG